MTVYNVSTAPSCSPIVAELNANVAFTTFASTEGLQIGDLYSSPNECDLIVATKTCPPVNGTFVKHVNLKF